MTKPGKYALIGGGIAAAAGLGYWIWKRKGSSSPAPAMVATKTAGFGAADPIAKGKWIYPVPIYDGIYPEINAPFSEPRPSNPGQQTVHTGVDIDYLNKAKKSWFAVPWSSPTPASIAWIPPLTPALAAGDGEVFITMTPGTKRKYPPCTSSGNVIAIDHGNGVITYYLHLSDTFVKKGDKVVAGQPLGIISNDPGRPGCKQCGILKSCPTDTKEKFDQPEGGLIHLHFEVHLDNGKTTIDPNRLLKKATFLDTPNDVTGAYAAYIASKPMSGKSFAQQFTTKSQETAAGFGAVIHVLAGATSSFQRIK
jgi:hypothetical protein